MSDIKKRNKNLSFLEWFLILTDKTVGIESLYLLIVHVLSFIVDAKKYKIIRILLKNEFLVLKSVKK